MIKDLPPVLLLGSYTGTLSHVVSAGLKRIKGLRVYLLEDRYSPYGNDGSSIIRFSRFIDGYHEILVQDPGEKLEVLSRVLDVTGAGVLMPVGESTVELANNAAQELEARLKVVPLPSTQVLQDITHKSNFSEYLKSRGLPAPPTWNSWDLPKALDQVRDHHFPLLAKPSYSQGGLGIRTLYDLPSLEKFLEWQSGTGADYILQKKASGPSIDINALFEDGRLLASCAQQTLNHHLDGFDFPRTVSIFKNSSIEQLAQDLLGPVKWGGAAHIDMIWHQGQDTPWFLEVNGRWWGTLYGSILAGINFPWLAYTLALDLPWEEPVFHPIVYNHGVSALFNNLRRMLNGGGLSYNPLHTNFVYTLSDPLHLAAQVGERLEILYDKLAKREDPRRQLEYNPD